MINRLVYLLLVGMLTACASSQAATVDPPQPTKAQHFRLMEPFSLPLGQSVTLENTDIAITFVRVPFDQRCASCTASGNANVVVELAFGGQPAQELVMYAFPVEQNYAEATPYTVQMLNLTPRRGYPNETVDASKYVVTLRVDKPTITCQPQANDPQGYLLKLCTYIQTRHIDVQPADPTQYRIKRIENRDDHGRAVVWVFLDCCGMGDIGIIDTTTGGVISFRQGTQ